MFVAMRLMKELTVQVGPTYQETLPLDHQTGIAGCLPVFKTYDDAMEYLGPDGRDTDIVMIKFSNSEEKPQL